MFFNQHCEGYFYGVTLCWHHFYVSILNLFFWNFKISAEFDLDQESPVKIFHLFVRKILKIGLFDLIVLYGIFSLVYGINVFLFSGKC